MSKRVWKLQDFTAHPSGVHCARLGEKSGQVLATGGDDKKVNIWKVGKAHALTSLPGHSSAAECLVFDKQEEVLVVGTAGGSMQVWNLEYRRSIGTLSGHRTACQSVEFHPYGEFFASGSADTNLKIWDLRRKSCIQTYRGHQGAISSIRFSPHGRWVATGGQDAQVKIWDLTAGKLMNDLDLHRGAITSIAFHPKEHLLATGAADRTTKLWSLETFKVLGTTDIGSSQVQAVKFYHEEKCVLSACQDALRVYSIDGMSQVDSIDVDWRGLKDMRHVAVEEKLLGVSAEGSQIGLWVADLQKRDAMAKGAYGRLPVRTGSGTRERQPTAPSRRPEQAIASEGRADVEFGGISDSQVDVGREDEVPYLPSRFQVPSTDAGPRRSTDAVHAKPVSRSTEPEAADSPRAREEKSLAERAERAQRAAEAAMASVAAVAGPLEQRVPEGTGTPPSQDCRPTTAEGRPPRTPMFEDGQVGHVAPSALSPIHRPDVNVNQLAQLGMEHQKMLVVLRRRQDTAIKMRTAWNRGDVNALRCQLPLDHAACCDLLRAIMRSQSGQILDKLNLDACHAILPTLQDIAASKYDEFVVLSMDFAELLLQHIGDDIVEIRQGCAQMQERHMDFAREERLKKCNVCYDNFKEINRLLLNSRFASQRKFQNLRSSLHHFLR